MKFGRVPVAQAEGAILVHSRRNAEGTLKKGQVLLRSDIEALMRSGAKDILVARLEQDDIHENKAAALIAAAAGGVNVRLDKASTGRVNMFAEVDGLVRVDPDLLARLNRIDEAITVATLEPFARVAAGRMVATVKIIPYAVRKKSLDRALAIAQQALPLIAVRRFRAHRAGLVQTRVAGTADKVLDKTQRVLGDRLRALGSELGEEIRCAHETDEIAVAVRNLAESGHDPVIVFGASAISDRRDMVPAGIEAAGGVVEAFGMPVDPGNLLLLAKLGKVPVIGAPGCARSPKENGFDWVLERLLAGLKVKREDIAAMGAGGLLMEIETRPRPRLGAEAEAVPEPRVAALVLAAGRSRRMAGVNKLLEDFAGKPLVRHAVEAALASRADPVTVVTGHMEDAVRTALNGLGVEFVHNPDFAQGLSTSLRAGLAAIGEEADGVIVCLADMPGVSAGLLDSLIDAFSPSQGRLIVVPTYKGKRGNPVLFSTRFSEALMAVKGDVGARHLIGANAEAVVEVEADRAALIDVDTPDALAAARRALVGEPAEPVVQAETPRQEADRPAESRE